jgi:plasmid stability protein
MADSHLMSLMIASDVMPRTTVDLDASVLAELRRRAAREHKSMGRLASELLAQQLTDGSSAGESKALPWISRDLGLPRVDLKDKEALSGLLDRSL